MSESVKGIVIASVILGIALVVSTAVVTTSLTKAQRNAFAFLEAKKNEVRCLLGNQKKELKRIAAMREEKIRNLVREELKNADIEVKKQPAQ